MTTRWMGGWCVAACALVALTGCMKSGTPAVPPADGKTAPAEASKTPAPAAPQAAAPAPATPVVLDDGDWLVERLSSEPAHLNPLTSSDYYASSVNAMIFESLLERDNKTLEHIPRVAERWEVSVDHLVYTFYLRKEACFSDGKPLTAADVKFTFDKVMDPKTDAPHLRNYFQDITNCEAVDDHTIRFTAKKPYFRHLTMIGGLEILPRHIYGEGDFNNHPNNRAPIGSGPYAFEKWDTGLQIVLTRNEKYWKEKPHILKRVYKIITDANAAFQVLTRQELDAMVMTPEIFTHRANAPEFTSNYSVLKYYSGNYNYVGWNLRLPQFSDKMVRRALTMLLDRKTILDTIFYGLGKQVTGEAFVNSPEYDTSVQPWPYDPAQAKQLLDAAGWVDSDGDGIRDKGGVPFKFEMQIRASSPEGEQIATVFQESLKSAGIAMTIRPLEWATFIQNVDARKFEGVILGWSVPPIENDPYQVWHSSQAEKGSNYIGFVNPEADKLIEDARLEFDNTKRYELLHRFHAILHEEQPYTFLFCLQEIDAVHKRFQNVVVYPAGTDSREWGVPKDQQKYH